MLSFDRPHPPMLPPTTHGTELASGTCDAPTPHQDPSPMHLFLIPEVKSMKNRKLKKIASTTPKTLYGFQNAPMRLKQSQGSISTPMAPPEPRSRAGRGL